MFRENHDESFIDLLELNEEALEKEGRILVDDILSEVAKKFDGEFESSKKLEYHNSEHSRDVVERMEKILTVLEKTGYITKKDKMLGIICAAGHDLVQGIGSEINEEKSVEEVFGFMDKSGIFDDEDKEKVKEAILATVAKMETNENGPIISQINLTEESSLLARALALADIGTAGVNTEKFLEEGDKLRKEFNIPLAKKKDWDKSQAGIAINIAKEFENKLNGFPEDARGEIKKQYQFFDDSIKAAQRRAS
ncbi:hypothetical protein HZC33_00155 [Candidatus Wolfebacteria bacterium]|nr:hypothetical protein [Candidatus Wolfebacteria bacterium]